ncbi:Similar to alpha-Man-IIa: Alpha-mannosidase 2 (Drosophila melanogaster) [Cotesia congregata]|uniref:Similar to alpha-Man-IIa: Alpha-mannosidase 2 (Drosophila melanogaster) n=1 Tax=Cotesia congregata TaxID=51543 RepID=A0A8J2H7Y2_COTCN|nr:Similar to alpha-Man-IIa: Alpha-mannosidase 2 (Drosophila melanogaster) [Cotesia congregata]
MNPDLYFSLDEVRSHHTSIEDKYILSFGTNDETSKQIVVYNSLPRKRSKVQTLIVSTPFVKVTGAKNELLECQISPIWNMNGSTASKEIHFVGNNLLPSTHFANVTLFNVPSSDRPEIPGFKVEILPLREFSITQGISAHFAESGLLKSLQIGGVTTSVNLEFVKYSTTKSGAYLFAPSKPNPDPLYTTDNHVIHLVTGPILSRVFVQLPEVNHTCTLFNSNGSDDLGLRIDNQVDVFDTYNFERSQFSPLNFDLPVDLEVSNLRVIQIFEGSGKNLGAVFHRHAIDTCWNNQSIGQYKLSSNGEINVDKLFRFYKNWTINEASLTFNSVGALLSEPKINLCPHQISAFLLNKP